MTDQSPTTGDNRCVICRKHRDYELVPLSWLENDPSCTGGVCRERFDAQPYLDGKTCLMYYTEMAMRRLSRQRWPNGRPPSETERLTDAIKELTRALSPQDTLRLGKDTKHGKNAK